jgi:UDP-glucuronate 4-epimerase
MKIILGAAGFIGFHLTKSLAQTYGSSAILAIDSFDETLYDSKIKMSRTDILRDLGVEVLHTQQIGLDWAKSVNDDDVVFNLAAVAGLTPSWSNSKVYFENNTLMVSKLLETFAQEGSSPVFVQASTSSVYGVAAHADVLAPTQPSSPYGISKLAAEHLLNSYSGEFGIRSRILRLFSVYGPHQRPDQFFSIALRHISQDKVIQIFGDGTNRRANVFVDDAVRALILASEYQGRSLTVDISGSESMSVIDVLESTARLLGKKPTFQFMSKRPGDQTTTAGDLVHTSRVLGWKPEVRFEIGLAQLVSHFRSHPECY